MFQMKRLLKCVTGHQLSMNTFSGSCGWEVTLLHSGSKFLINKWTCNNTKVGELFMPLRAVVLYSWLATLTTLIEIFHTNEKTRMWSMVLCFPVVCLLNSLAFMSCMQIEDIYTIKYGTTVRNLSSPLSILSNSSAASCMCSCHRNPCCMSFILEYTDTGNVCSLYQDILPERYNEMDSKSDLYTRNQMSSEWNSFHQSQGLIMALKTSCHSHSCHCCAIIIIISNNFAPYHCKFNHLLSFFQRMYSSFLKKLNLLGWHLILWKEYLISASNSVNRFVGKELTASLLFTQQGIAVCWRIFTLTQNLNWWIIRP